MTLDDAKRIVSDLSYEYPAGAVREACEAILTHLAALERVAAAAEAYIDSDDDYAIIAGAATLRKALAAMRESEGGG